MSITEKRQQEIAFTDKLYAANARLIAPKGSKLLPTVDALKGKSVGVLQGTTQEAYANAMWQPKGITVVPYQNQDRQMPTWHPAVSMLPSRMKWRAATAS